MSTQDPITATDHTRVQRLSIAHLFSLKGKTVLVTGASSGMGEALAIAAATAGGQVIAVARRIERLKHLAAHDAAITPIACDLSVDLARQELVRQVRGSRRVDVLVNTAGTIGEVAAAEDESVEQIARTLEVNLIAPLRLAQAFAPEMRKTGEGSIINIASISGLVGIGRIPQASYVASKSGLVGLTRELAAQWGRWGIRVNAIAAGYFRSDMTASLFETPKLAEWVRVRQPLPFTAVPDDFAGAMLLLASTAGRFITGQTFAVDGGWTAL
jgi:NAD(P)-dependent dehydrogenase (short-subunit alcohol dehydrogenase family)